MQCPIFLTPYTVLRLEILREIVVDGPSIQPLNWNGADLEFRRAYR